MLGVGLRLSVVLRCCCWLGFGCWGFAVCFPAVVLLVCVLAVLLLSAACRAVVVLSGAAAVGLGCVLWCRGGGCFGCQGFGRCLPAVRLFFRFRAAVGLVVVAVLLVACAGGAVGGCFVRLDVPAVRLCFGAAVPAGCRCCVCAVSVVVLLCAGAAGCRLCFSFRKIQQRKTKSIFAKIEKENEVIKK